MTGFPPVNKEVLVSAAHISKVFAEQSQQMRTPTLAEQGFFQHCDCSVVSLSYCGAQCSGAERRWKQTKLMTCLQVFSEIAWPDLATTWSSHMGRHPAPSHHPASEDPPWVNSWAQFVFSISNDVLRKHLSATSKENGHKRFKLPFELLSSIKMKGIVWKFFPWSKIHHHKLQECCGQPTQCPHCPGAFLGPYACPLTRCAL